MNVDRDLKCERLIAAGVPAQFLRALEEGANPAVEFCYKPPEDFYYYVEDADAGWPALEDALITPVCESDDGTTYYLLVKFAGEADFVWADLEGRDVVSCGSDFRFVMARILIEYYESGEDPSQSQFSDAADGLGYVAGRELYQALEEADRSTFASFAAWKKRVLPTLILKS